MERERARFLLDFRSIWQTASEASSRRARFEWEAGQKSVAMEARRGENYERTSLGIQLY
jgi:hypothetical protein